MSIKNYVLGGKGYALKWFFLVTLGISLFVYFGIEKLGQSFFKDPTVENFFKQIPVIEIKNGEVVQKGLDIKLSLPDSPFTFLVINTKDNQDVKMDFSSGIYFAQKLVYLKNNASVQVATYSEFFGTDNFMLTPEVLKDLFMKIVKILSVLGIIFIFSLVYILLCTFTWTGMFLVGKKMPLNVCARLSFFAFLSVVVLELTLILVSGVSYFQTLILGSVLIECIWLSKNYITYQNIQDIDEVLSDMQEDLKDNTVIKEEKEIVALENESVVEKDKKKAIKKKTVSKRTKKEQ